jgi:hypothetical protein
MKMAVWGIAIGSVAFYRGHLIDCWPLSATLVGVVATGSSFFTAWWATLLTPLVAIRAEPGAREARA